MAYIKWAFWGIVALFVVAFFHYTLPQRDIVYVTGVEIKLEQFGENSIFWAAPDSGAAAQGGTIERDVRFIDTVQRDGDVMVYRNEDTGFWPPYFKFDSSNLQAEARDLVSNRSDPQWVIVTHYGWRIPFLTAYPNAIAVKATDTPDATLIPWVNIVILLIVAAVVWALRVRWVRFRRRRIDPMVGSMDESWDDFTDSARERRGRVSRWLGSWRR
ncbi:hypothetical protein OB2597_13643 [Pseudooceanicola batsensis HTCC2597]|uniref:DUF1523 domain-containing protein n=1 Tax=Pseudooceanicola batsensis (strain ATCC BAA-863 / DSM 15984 / KCTC 12145 / HTCC2597) TaxID=252305 RepID=A3TYF7_PSEBH|nr:DUF1523 family protein [Pseudooceanicola batsensis]EAQ03191.1 hypothetical protein OB2597_13643 [Pseudooceanicola batsensis HTCC2597]